MLQFKENKHFFNFSRSFFCLLLFFLCFCSLTTATNAGSFSEEQELEEFISKLQKPIDQNQIGYIIQIYKHPCQQSDLLLKNFIGQFFYKGRDGYLTHASLEQIKTLTMQQISYRILDKKLYDDLKERWFLVEFKDRFELASIKSRFEPLFIGTRATLIRIRPADAIWLSKNNLDYYLVAENKGACKSDDKIINLPYFSQYKNKLNPGGTCQNTCLAMVLRHYGWKGVPDDITRVWGSKIAQTPEGGAKVFNSYAQKLGLLVRASGYRKSYGSFRQKLSKGHPLIVHGYFTAGHVVIANSCDGSLYDCHDPAGKWNQVFKGSYNTGVSGKNQKYRKSNFDKAISPDGMVWWVEFNQVAYVDSQNPNTFSTHGKD